MGNLGTDDGLGGLDTWWETGYVSHCVVGDLPADRVDLLVRLLSSLLVTDWIHFCSFWILVSMLAFTATAFHRLGKPGMCDFSSQLDVEIDWRVHSAATYCDIAARFSDGQSLPRTRLSIPIARTPDSNVDMTILNSAYPISSVRRTNTKWFYWTKLRYITVCW